MELPKFDPRQDFNAFLIIGKKQCGKSAAARHLAKPIKDIRIFDEIPALGTGYMIVVRQYVDTHEDPRCHYDFVMMYNEPRLSDVIRLHRRYCQDLEFGQFKELLSNLRPYTALVVRMLDKTKYVYEGSI